MELAFHPLKDENIHSAADILLQMNEGMSVAEIADSLRYLLATYSHYSCIGAWKDNILVGVSGYWIAHRVWCGKYIEPDNVAVSTDYQNQGIGAALMNEIIEIGRLENCKMMTLDSYTSNRASHRFYHRMGFEIYGFHFVKPLSS